MSSLKKHDLYNDATNSLGPRYEVLSKVKSYYAEMPQSLDCNVFTPSIHRSRSVATVVDSPTTALQHKQSSSIVCLNTINMILYCFSNNKKYDKIIHQVSKILCFFVIIMTTTRFISANTVNTVKNPLQPTESKY